mmetsp:Transcript_139958/g.390185  ORF Transcript_139958/g.390185 Transcript_139958/m.390185 type:complete len:197 (+) Transcript_139958:402-992(+)
MQEWHMDSLPSFKGFHFELVETPFAMVTEAEATPGRKTVVSRGTTCMWNTVLGSQAIPAEGTSYFEVEVLRIGSVNASFILGVAEEAIKRDTHMGGSVAVGVSFRPPTSAYEVGHTNGFDRSSSFPKIERGSKIGVFVNMGVGQVAFYVGGKMRLIHGKSVAGKTLYPAFSVYADTVLQVHAGMEPPNTEKSFILD